MALASRSLHVKPNLDSSWDSRYPQGDKPQTAPASIGVNLAAFLAANINYLAEPQNTAISQNYRGFLTGTSAPTATLTVNAVSGALGNWVFDNANNNLTNSALTTGSGSLQVVASDGTNTASFPIQNWSIVAANPSGVRLKHPLGIWIYLDQNIMFGNNLSVTLSRMDQLVALLGDNLVGFSIYPNWGLLEGPTLGLYDGSWSSDRANRPKGFDLIDAMLAKCGSYSKPRYLKINNFIFAGGGTAGGTPYVFPSNWMPGYMSSPTYGPTSGAGTGIIAGAWVNSYASGRTELYFPRWWDVNFPGVHNRIRALDTAYGARYDSHPLLASFSSLSEFVIPTTTGYPNSTNELSMLQALFLGANGYFAHQRASWPTSKCHMFFNFTSNQNNQKILIDECAKYSISIGAPDIIYRSTGPSYSWDQFAYQGINPSTRAVDPSYTNYVGKLDYIASFEPIDLDGNHGTVAQLWSILNILQCCSVEVFDNRFSGPPATNQFPGIATTLNQLMSSQPLNKAYPPLFQGA